VAERSGDTAFQSTGLIEAQNLATRLKAPSPLRSAGALHRSTGCFTLLVASRARVNRQS